MKAISGLEFLKEIENKNIKENTTYTIIDNEDTQNKTKVIFNGYDCDPIFEHAHSHDIYVDINWFINTTVEIIEEDKDIEEIDLADCRGNGECVISVNDEKIQNKINELVQEVNKLKRR